MISRTVFRLFVIAVLLSGPIMLFSQPNPGTGELWTVNVGPDGVPRPHRTVLPESAFGFATCHPKLAAPWREEPVPVLEQALEHWLRQAKPEDQADLIVTFADEVTLPTLPALNPHKSYSDPENQAIIARRRTMANEVAAQRQPKYDRRRSDLARLGIVTKEVFWSLDAMVLRSPAKMVNTIASLSDVQAVEFTHTSAKPAYVQTGRAQIRTDYLKNGAQNNPGTFWPRVAVIDSGAPAVHHVFTPRQPTIALAKECVAPSCADTNLVDHCNHATSVAANLAALATDGDLYSGVTPFQIGTYDVFWWGGVNDCTFDRPSGARAVDTAIIDGFPVFVTGVQDPGEDEFGTISTAFDHAFQTGTAVFAVNGNYGRDANGQPVASSVASPARSHYTIGVGAYDYQTFQTYFYQSLGPVPSDGRIKPDLQAPSNVITADPHSPGAYWNFWGTSAAAPFAAGAGALTGWMMNPGMWGGYYNVPPGQIYAYLIDMGRNSTPIWTNGNTIGAGRIVLPGSGVNQWYGPVTLQNGQYVDIPLLPTTTGSAMSAAIWWADPGITRTDTRHNDIDLSLFDYQGHLVALSDTASSVFEKVTAGPVNPSYGTWTVRIYAYWSPYGSQTVYYSAHVVVN